MAVAKCRKNLIYFIQRFFQESSVIDRFFSQVSGGSLFQSDNDIKRWYDSLKSATSLAYLVGKCQEDSGSVQQISITTEIRGIHQGRPWKAIKGFYSLSFNFSVAGPAKNKRTNLVICVSVMLDSTASTVMEYTKCRDYALVLYWNSKIDIPIFANAKSLPRKLSDSIKQSMVWNWLAFFTWTLLP